MKISGITTSIAAIAISAGMAFAEGLPKIPMLTLDVAKKMAAACEAMSVEQGWRMDIAVVDRGANLVLFHRMDNAFLISTDIAIGKATTSARIPFPSRAVANLAHGKDGAPGALPGIAFVDGVITFAGGLPIMAGDVHVGGIGVSGDTADNDEKCAQAGIDAVAGDLK